MRGIRIDAALDIKAVSEDGQIEGYAAVFGNVDHGLDRIERGAFRESLKQKSAVPMLWQHDPRAPIGVWTEMKEDSRGLKVAGEINLDTQQGREARSLTRQGAIGGLSIGYRAEKWEFDGDVRVLKRLSVHEASLATLPMNEEAIVIGLKNATGTEFERLARDQMGLSVNAAKALRAGGWSGLCEYFKSGSAKRGDDSGRGAAQCGDDVLAKLASITNRMRI